MAYKITVETPRVGLSKAFIDGIHVGLGSEEECIALAEELMADDDLAGFVLEDELEFRSMEASRV
jgi:hypothetical protein